MTTLSTEASPASETESQENAELGNQPDVTEAVTADANAAESSPAEPEDAKEPASLLSVIKDAVKKDDPAPEESSTPEGKEERSEVEPEDGDKPTEEKAEDDADLPFHNHPRFKALIEERNTLREPAERYGKITEFMQEHKLEPGEVAEGFEIMALLKSGTAEGLGKAREWFAERLGDLDRTLGNSLPDDLRERVENGMLDEETAQELAQARANATLSETRTAADQARADEARQTEQAAARTHAMASAVTDWETRQKVSDPDYSKKAELVETTCRAIVQREGKAPTTPEEATALADRALAEVNRQFKAVMPKPKPIAPSPRSTSANTAPAPKTLREAIEGAVAAR